MKIYLASRSPRRCQLLRQIGVEYELLDVDMDESWNGIETAGDYVCRIASEKAAAGKQQIVDSIPVLAADTAVVLNGTILGKAETPAMARNMLRQLSGKRHQVLSAVTVIAGGQSHTLLNENNVTFASLSGPGIDQYCQAGEPIGKAGGYAIQGRAAIFIERLEGSYSGVMGLPLYETNQLLMSLATERARSP